VNAHKLFVVVHRVRLACARRWSLVIMLAAITAALWANGPGAATRQARVPDAFFVPSRFAVADAMLQLAEVTAADVVYDLGSGDGRIVILAAQKYGARGVGIEIDPALVAKARQVAIDGQVQDKVVFVEGDLFTADISPATVVTLYLSTLTNRRLAVKLQRELRPGTRIVSQQFDLGPWAPDLRTRVEGAELFLWRVK
jgi:SAM-dependent methyltransferase